MIGTSFTVSEVARFAGYTRQHVTRLCRAGVVPGAHQTKGGHWRVRPSKKLQGWLQTIGGTAPQREILKGQDAVIESLIPTLRQVWALETAEKVIRRKRRALERMIYLSNLPFLQAKMQAWSDARVARGLTPIKLRPPRV